MILAIVMISPWFAAAGLAAVGLAVWMHLYERVASKRHAVSSLRLMPETPYIANHRQRIRRWPLLLLRALGVILLGLAFARPSILSGSQKPLGSRETVAFVLDHSASMGMQNSDGISAWQQSIQQVQERLDGMHPQSRVRIFCDPPAETGEDWSSPAVARKVLNGLTLSMREGHPFEALRDGAEALARFRSDMPESLEIIGDLQKIGWENIDPLTLPEEVRVTVSQIGDPTATNRGLALQVRGSDHLRHAVMTFSGGATPLQVTDRREVDRVVVEQEIPLPDAAVELPYRAEKSGWVRREVGFRQSSDGLATDDRVFDTFYVAPEIPVYLLEPDTQRDVFLQKTFFLNQALRPTLGEAASDSRFRPKVLPVKSAVKTIGNLTGSDAVVVVPPLAEWPEGLPAAVDAYVRQGGAVVFFAGQEMNPVKYKSAWREILPAIPGAIFPVNGNFALPTLSESHPIWGSFSSDFRQAMRNLQLKQRYALTTAEGAEVIAHFADHLPLVVRRQVGKGRALFVNTSPDRAWGDWCADGSLFVPTVHRLMAAVLPPTPQALGNSPGAGLVGVPFDVLVDPALAGAFVKSGEQTVKVDPQGWVCGLSYDQPGLYDLLAADGSILRPVAVNVAPSESMREFFLPKILQRQIEARRRGAGETGEAPRIDIASESGVWRWILYILAVIWLMEAWLALPKTEILNLKAKKL
jgi:Aerotolerance regulator N-terminal